MNELKKSEPSSPTTHFEPPRPGRRSLAATRPGRSWAGFFFASMLALTVSSLFPGGLAQADTCTITNNPPPDATVQCGSDTSTNVTGTSTTSTCTARSPLTITHADTAPVEVTTGSPNGWSFALTGAGTAA